MDLLLLRIVYIRLKFMKTREDAAAIAIAERSASSDVSNDVVIDDDVHGVRDEPDVRDELCADNRLRTGSV